MSEQLTSSELIIISRFINIAPTQEHITHQNSKSCNTAHQQKCLTNKQITQKKYFGLNAQSNSQQGKG